ncbi:unnamed protein product [Schistosoma curassoni]|uniref:DUF2568 domain-containing protein n=1 Tax=Schistosoma curassoni TaxID=6186 RepID=A0A183JSF7_9TREM|nr:unnamed protein product [Schistosoma curassoni]
MNPTITINKFGSFYRILEITFAAVIASGTYLENKL